MKNAFQPPLIGRVMLTILLFGVMTIAQKRGPPSKPKTCIDMYPINKGECDITQCRTECIKKRKGDSFCTKQSTGKSDCVCLYSC
ncbi:unnamed protein product [Brassica rapa]|uniref:Knottin scorpion toxin-like domain-containing protein n=1 Tax=Brassica campestris TaxID=3711 RepID=A0A3P6BBV6_BRACM|nr:unnamed protein product [Brassica rapa]VDD02683.1 unnamed protein product [Brassica rapa]